ncbi:mycothiol-dependent nitroreductase Rv2466c family protein [Agrococcus sp. Marseille-P2731]|uniref:mycothiol-dependent nitroreductase Rv2466c family protein n=1 Tax=Agrococcus sp. Marseille-P2731 TaxID=1841862 RepID=UPI000931BC5A|nr:DsbA family protein [Agrococcus sp. Marseille-P2731]
MTDEAQQQAPQRVRMWFDPTCPWAWMTSRWLGEVAEARGLAVDWQVMSLAVLNEGRDLPEAYAKRMPRSMRLTRLVTAARAAGGDAVVKPLYDALGERIHHQGRKDDDALIAEALAEAGVDASLVQETDEHDASLRASHQVAIDLVGDDVGTPVIAVDDVAFFGPVVSPAPKGADALRLFDGIVAAASIDGFFELKRSRTRDPQFDVEMSPSDGGSA